MLYHDPFSEMYSRIPYYLLLVIYCICQGANTSRGLRVRYIWLETTERGSRVPGPM